MAWFLLTAVFTDHAYKICESDVCKKKKSPLGNYARDE